MPNNEALARELRKLGYLHKFDEPECTDAMYRAADALEAKWAAEREALAEALWLAERRGDWPIWQDPVVTKEPWLMRADRLFASGVLKAVRVPTREEIAHAIAAAEGQVFDEEYGQEAYWNESSEAIHEDWLRQADAVLALMAANRNWGARAG